MITNDNPSLSLPIIQPESIVSGAPGNTSKFLTTAVTDRAIPQSIADYVTAATADNTRRAYRSDLRAFIAWGASLPASPETVAAYLVAQAPVLSPVTLSRRLVAIGQAHTLLGYRNPCHADLVRRTLRGIWRLHGRPQRQVATGAA